MRCHGEHINSLAGDHFITQFTQERDISCQNVRIAADVNQIFDLGFSDCLQEFGLTALAGWSKMAQSSAIVTAVIFCYSSLEIVALGSPFCLQ